MAESANEYQLLLLLEIVMKRLERAMIERIHRAGFPEIRGSHGNVYGTISPEGSRVSEMAARAGITQQSMSELVDDLESSGYVVRRPDPQDRRARIVELTEKGWACSRVAIQAVRDLEAEWGELIGPRRMQAVRSGLVRLIENTDEPVSG